METEFRYIVYITTTRSEKIVVGSDLEYLEALKLSNEISDCIRDNRMFRKDVYTFISPAAIETIRIELDR